MDEPCSGGDFYLDPSGWDQINKRIDDEIACMAPGDTTLYHSGFLAIDRANDPVVDHIACRYLLHGTPFRFAFGVGCKVSGTGKGRLTQVKVRDCFYMYYFTKNRRPQRIVDYR